MFCLLVLLPAWVLGMFSEPSRILFKWLHRNAARGTPQFACRGCAAIRRSRGRVLSGMSCHLYLPAAASPALSMQVVSFNQLASSCHCALMVACFSLRQHVRFLFVGFPS